jgi:hypothetical protein
MRKVIFNKAFFRLTEAEQAKVVEARLMEIYNDESKYQSARVSDSLRGNGLRIIKKAGELGLPIDNEWGKTFGPTEWP